MTKKKASIQELPDVRAFVAWVNTLCCDGGNLYRLSKIYERDRDKILKNAEVQENLEYLKTVQP